MIQKHVDRIIQRQLDDGVIKDEEAAIYRYGYILLIELVINIVVACIIAAVFHTYFELFMFLLAFIPIRIYAGGYHADAPWQCVILSNVILFTATMIIKSETAIFYLKYMAILEIPMLVYFFLAVPVPTKGRVLSENESIAYGRIAKGFYIIELLIMLIFLNQQAYKWMCIIFLAHWALIPMLIISVISNKRRLKQLE